jgi:hypothetical protein
MQKEELWKLKYFTCKNINLQKNPLKETKTLQDIINNSIITNLKFQHKPKYHHLSKNPHIKIDLLLLTRGQISLNLLLYSIMNLNTLS